MKQYQKPIMNIIEMEKVDVLTASGQCGLCSYYGTGLYNHYKHEHSDVENPYGE